MLLYYGELTSQERLSPEPSFVTDGHLLTGETAGHSGVSDYVATLPLISGLTLWLLLKGVRKLCGTIAFRRVERRRLSPTLLIREAPQPPSCRSFGSNSGLLVD